MPPASPASLTTARPLVALAPWIAFSVVDHRTSLVVGSAVALAVAAGAAVLARRGHRPVVLELTATVFFVALLVVVATTHPAANGPLDRYARALACVSLAVVAFGSLAFTPFTELYARLDAPSAVWSSPEFKRTNVLFTAAWGAVFAAMAVSHTVAGLINTHRAQTVGNWLVPIALVMVTLRWMASYRSRAVPGPLGG